jgi:hypothetical protein
MCTALLPPGGYPPAVNNIYIYIYIYMYYSRAIIKLVPVSPVVKENAVTSPFVPSGRAVLISVSVSSSF